MALGSDIQGIVDNLIDDSNIRTQVTLTAQTVSTGELSTDGNTSLLCHFNDSLTGEASEPGFASTGVTFVTGKLGKAVSIPTSETLQYTSSGNISKSEGTWEVWIKLQTAIEDLSSNSRIFEARVDANNYMSLRKHPSENDRLRFNLVTSATTKSCNQDTGFSWNTTDFFHVAITWSENENRIRMYINGILQSDTGNWQDVGTLTTTFYIGSDGAGSNQFNAYYDELRIYNRERTATEISVDYNEPTTNFGYGGLSETVTTTSTINCIPANYVKERINLQPFGDLQEGEVRFLVKDSTTLDTNDKITFDGNDYWIRSIDPIYFNGVTIAKALVLVKRTE